MYKFDTERLPYMIAMAVILIIFASIVIYAFRFLPSSKENNSLKNPIEQTELKKEVLNDNSEKNIDKSEDIETTIDDSVQSDETSNELPENYPDMELPEEELAKD